MFENDFGTHLRGDFFQVDFFDPTFDSDMIFGGCGALIFVIDAQVLSTPRIYHSTSIYVL